MIEVITLHKSFNGQEILHGINLKVNDGHVLALIGGSGKGKSVLLKHIIGLLCLAYISIYFGKINLFWHRQ